MPLQPGDRLGHYEIVSSLGAGGMGEVYRAKDTKLGREVAIKLLLEEVAGDPERVARFEREARVLASLNHPNIGAIYGLEEADDTKALVLELVEGPTLADRIALGPISIDEALPIAQQIAEALKAAHEQGVIHRDLKPANIKLRPDGAVKVLERCLEKEPRHRYHDVADARLDLEKVLDESETGLDARSRPRSAYRKALAWGIAGFGLGAIVAGAALWNWESAQENRPVRFSIEVPASESAQVLSALSGRVAISPDGDTIAYVGSQPGELIDFTKARRRQLYLRRVDELEPRAVEGSEGAQSPFFDPVGEWVGFYAGGKLQRVPTGGGEPLVISKASFSVQGVSWGPPTTASCMAVASARG